MSYLSRSAKRDNIKEWEDSEEQLLGKHLVDGSIIGEVSEHLTQLPSHHHIIVAATVSLSLTIGLKKQSFYICITIHF